MKQMIIHLNQQPTFGLFDAGPKTEMLIQSFRQGRFLQLPPVLCEQEGQDAAEEAFDLTNNPSRQDERMRRYGNGRSLSVGDIVETNGQFFLCMSFGWQEFTK